MNPGAPKGELPAMEKELKVRLPAPVHIKLHTIKVLHGQSIHDSVLQALEAYFRAFEAEHPAEHPGQRRLDAWVEAPARAAVRAAAVLPPRGGPL
jgi:hypothetical protein